MFTFVETLTDINMKKLLRLPKFIAAMVLLAIFFLIETILMIVYVILETPMSWLLDKVETIIKYLLKNL